MQECKINGWDMRFDIGGIRAIADAVGQPDELEPLQHIKSSYEKVAYIIWSGRIRFAKVNKQPIPDITMASCLDDLGELPIGVITSILNAYNSAHAMEAPTINGEVKDSEEKKNIAIVMPK